MRVYEILSEAPEINRIVEPQTDAVTRWSGRYPKSPGDVTHVYRNMSPAELEHVVKTGRFEPLNGEVKWWSQGDAEGVFGREFKSGATKPQVRVPIQNVQPNRIASALGAEVKNAATGAWEPLKFVAKPGVLARTGSVLGTAGRWLTGGPIGLALQALTATDDLNAGEEEELKRIRAMKEDEYDIFDKPNPNMVQTRAGGQHVPYESERDEGKEWDKLPLEIKLKWTQRQRALQARAGRIYQRMVAAMEAQDQPSVKGYKLVVPIRVALYQIAYNSYDDKEIALDLGTFWDMSDDSIAYVIGHELGHSVWYGRKRYKPHDDWATPAKKLRKVQEELDCDTYGAQLAYKLGYDPRHALQEFDAEGRSWRYDPKVTGQNYYPDYRMRQANLKKAIAQAKADQDAAKAAELQKQLDAETQKPQQDQGAEPTAPNDGTDAELNRAHQDMFNHISRGIANLSQATA